MTVWSVPHFTSIEESYTGSLPRPLLFQPLFTLKDTGSQLIENIIPVPSDMRFDSMSMMTPLNIPWTAL